MSVPVTPGSGTTMAADLIGTGSAPTSGQQVSYAKLDGGIAGASAPIQAGNAANLAARVSTNALQTVGVGQFGIVHTPAVNTQATISQAAGASGVRNVCQSITVSLAQDATGSVQTGIQFNLRDGATGTGTILWSITMALPATPGDCRVFSISGLNIVGSAATAMTLETVGTPASHTAASVSFQGYSTPNA